MSAERCSAPALTRRPLLALALGLSPWLLAGCGQLRSPSLPMPPAEAQRGLHLLPGLPEDGLPEHAVPLPQAQTVLLPAESSLGHAVDLLIPVPFVVDALTDEVNASSGRQLAPRLGGLTPRALLQQALLQLGSPPLRDEGLDTRVFLFAQACVDDRFRFALTAQLRGTGWQGRYLVHLPLLLDSAAFRRAEPAALAALQQGLAEAAGPLASLLDRATRGALPASGPAVNIGSLHLVGGRSLGLINPRLMTARDAQLIEENADTVLVRMAGLPGQSVANGGLFFGVHLLPRSQLHTFEKSA